MTSLPAESLADVLVVDDQPEIRRLLRVALARRCRVIEAVDGPAALDCVRASHPRAVLLDIMMPGPLDGLQVLDALKADPATRPIKVAMLSARGQEADLANARQRGADAYFTKPFSPLQVLAWVGQVLSAGDDAADRELPGSLPSLP
ncbi:MAG: hypothetical protein RIQ60_3525 [Pseudomonadota bacterium]|jgi:CheY-like chemotaxis protein